ncbi:Uncharacterized protein MSYG_2778 [Malassezia sympodialis ATCC 42132]|uniref:Uncharacterized protein n=1 Tax=Malassezia sympodialis (strain ATCC 42132) TaxID=1230383 RepID=A0A1M8A7I2_MALS4|nr:Uncharacterized protein MSYG_2778 [Malassezia sympodialis ATCC 42132]
MDGYADAQAGVKHDHAVGHAAHLDALEESVNRQIDADVQTLMDNMRELILLSRIGDKDHFDVQREKFLLETRADSMVQAAQSLYLLSDSLKLSLLLSQSSMSEARDHEAQELLEQTNRHIHKCGQLLAEHLAGAQAMSSPESPQPN